jgi:hypothetical protein
MEIVIPLSDAFGQTFVCPNCSLLRARFPFLREHGSQRYKENRLSLAVLNRPGVNSLTATTFDLLLSFQSRLDHGRSAAYAAFHVDGAGDAIELAGAAFHASLWADQHSLAAVHLESAMRADLHAHAAAIAESWIINECIFQVGI